MYMTENVPRMMTVRQVARTGLLPEHALRLMLKAGKLPAIFVGNKVLINYDRLCEQLSTLGADLNQKPDKQWFQ
jgi:excisionase family DNA binding protein